MAREGGRDASREFLNSLPKLEPGETFWFACHPEVPCFNACCSGLTMPLTPYDVLRLCTGLGIDSESFIEDYAEPGCYEDTGFPLLHLRMDPPPGRFCPFLTADGCGIYEHRSSACRTYPLGRATRPYERGGEDGGKDGGEAGQGVVEQYFLVREDHCRGFLENKGWSIDSWLKDQGIGPYNRMNDRYMRLMARYKAVAGGALLGAKHATMALLCLYQQDKFADLITSLDLFARVCLQGEYGQDPGAAREAIMADPEARLWFAFDWLELALLGSCPNLAPAAP